MAETTEHAILLSGKYEVPWPHKIVTHGGIHPATKFRKTFKVAGIMMIILGVLSIVMSIAASAETLRVGKQLSLPMMYHGAGYWSGGTFLVTGVAVFVCGRYNVMRCTLILAFVFSTFTMVGTGFVCYWSFNNAVAYGLYRKFSLSVLEGIIGGIAILEGCVALTVTLLGGSTLCTCSNQMGYAVSTAKNGMTVQII